LPNGKSASFFGILDSKTKNPCQYQNDFDGLQSLVLTGLLAPHIHQTYTLDDVAEAHNVLESGKAIGFLVIANETTKTGK
jgi:NADPH:quinone reductase-like Zn-dependent oxidoreductase